MKTLGLFPGQGSQQVGMGKSLVEQFPAAAELFAQADQILGTPFSTLMFEGPAEILDDTLNTLPSNHALEDGLAHNHVLSQHRVDPDAMPAVFG